VNATSTATDAFSRTCTPFFFFLIRAD
jgi:hypothetical protein